AEDGVSAVQTAEGALTEVHSMLQRMNELAVQAANGTNSEDDRQAIQDEIDQLITEIDRVAETTKFNETYLLQGGSGAAVSVTLGVHDAGLAGSFGAADGDGNYTFTPEGLAAGSKYTIAGKEWSIVGTVKDANTEKTVDEAKAAIKAELLAANNIGADTVAVVTDDLKVTPGKANVAPSLSFNLHVGADADMTNKINVNIDAMSAAGLGVKGLDIKDTTGIKATYAIDAIADAVAKVSAQRSSLGAVQNRLEHTIANLDNVVENTTAAESRIRDTDMAEEMVEYSKNNILAQAGQSMLAQANTSTQGVLALLR
ncbi:MAG: flagellar hook protein, partial [Agathobacter sp.]|nr:flagellar hook protein [Agathobacter sp.]